MMRKISGMTPKQRVSDLSLTPPSSNQPRKFSDISMQQYEYDLRTDFTHKKSAATGPGGIPMLHENKDLRDMFESPIDRSTGTNLILILIGVVVGVGLGYFLDNNHVSKDANSWISLPGQLFIDALTCLITPMVFCSVVACIGELVLSGKAKSIGIRTLAYFAMASITSSSIGTIFGALFSSLFKQGAVKTSTLLPSVMAFQCPNKQQLTQLTNGSLVCSDALRSAREAQFYLNDTSGLFTPANITYSSLSVSDQIIGILNTLVPVNIVSSFATGSNLSVIMFAFVFGTAVVKGFDARPGIENYPLLLITHANVMLRMMINMVVRYMPIAVISLIAGSVASSDSATSLIENVVYLVLALGLALLTLLFGVMGTALAITTRTSIFSYLKHIFPAQVFIFGCSSSIATLPVTIRCVDSSGQVSRPLSRFVLSIGATSNLNGTAVYMALACIFLAKTGGYSNDLTLFNYIVLAIVSSISSFGVAPVPHSGLVMVITVWKTVFGHPMPAAFSILVGADWILNRMRAVVNITNDTIIARIIAEQCNETQLSVTGDFDIEDSILTPPSASGH